MIGQERVAEGAITILPKRASVDGEDKIIDVHNTEMSAPMQITHTVTDDTRGITLK